jgi:sugar/nucleoside kinase (ribokinase family)
MKKVLGLGNALVDLIINVDNENILRKFDLPKGSMSLVNEDTASLVLEETKDLPYRMAAGGSASNTINGLASLGVECGYLGKIGNDPYGELFKKEMLSNNIYPILLTGNHQTGMAITLLTKDAERTFATYLGSAVELKANDLIESEFRRYYYLHIEGYLVQNQDLILNAVKIAKRYGLKVSMDMASFNVVETNKMFLIDIIKKYVDIVFANEEEAKALTGKNPEDALYEISEWSELAIVKIGKEGSWIKKGDQVIKVDGIRSDLKDTTGAGDLYASGFLYGLVNDLDLELCGKIGSLVGGNVVEVYGARMEDDRWEEIKEGIEEIIRPANNS